MDTRKGILTHLIGPNLELRPEKGYDYFSVILGVCTSRIRRQCRCASQDLQKNQAEASVLASDSYLNKACRRYMKTEA